MLSSSSNDLDKQLFNAVKVDDANNVERLITLGANVNATTNDGVTPLHVAAINGHTQNVGVLIAQGGNINATDQDGDTPLHNAAYFCCSQTVERLIVLGANIYAVNKKGVAPISLLTAEQKENAMIEHLRQAKPALVMAGIGLLEGSHARPAIPMELAQEILLLNVPSFLIEKSYKQCVHAVRNLLLLSHKILESRQSSQQEVSAVQEASIKNQLSI